MKTAFIYSDAFSQFNYGASHPLRVLRLKLTYELIKSCGLLLPEDPRLTAPFPAGEADLLTYHTKEYIEVLSAVNSGKTVPGAARFGLGPGDNPVFPGLYDGSRLAAGASLLAASLVESGNADIVFNISGGLHHAMASRASGFCYINDPVLAIQSLVKKGRRVAYIDIDAHHGDGVQAAFYNTDKVLTLSLHETGAALFPGTGFEDETGAGAGKGYSVNIPLPPETDDDLFLYAFDSIVPSLIEQFSPDIIVSQLGVDTFRNDPLAHLNLTTNGFCEAIKRIKMLGRKWLALGGGGYNLANVARAWTLAWAIMNDAEAPLEIPGSFLRRYPGAGFLTSKLRDEKFSIAEQKKELLKKEVDNVLEYIKDGLCRISKPVQAVQYLKKKEKAT
jgi:acetoin utilization protein AcuC